MNTDLSRFFVAGGTLRPDAASYVPRAADYELLEHTLAGDFCYVLTARQMGKSSLMQRTARRLATQDVVPVIIDLTAIGSSVDEIQWYLGLLMGVEEALMLQTDVGVWWQAHADLSAVQRFCDFLRQVVLVECTQPIVIFVDEIDATLKLPFRDDFFAAVRALYNARAHEPQLERLTFVLLGVAAPTDLIADRTRTPFNIGHAIMLQEFSRTDAAVLREGLEKVYPGQGQILFDHIYAWTDGHPYLTQKLCQEVVLRDVPPNAVDTLVRTIFLSEETHTESNLQHVQDLLLKHSQCVELLQIYRKVLRSSVSCRKVADNGQSPLHNHLKLSGLVKAESGVLRVRNKIYQCVFDRAWVQEHLPTSWRVVATAILAVVAAVAVTLIVYSGWANARSRACYYDFNQTGDVVERLDRLATLFELWNPLNPIGYTRDAYTLFFGLTSRQEQLDIFTGYDLDVRQIEVVARGLYVTLADVEDTGVNTELLIVMRDALPEDVVLYAELSAWIEGRDLYCEGQYEEALAHYTVALGQKISNPAILYERAKTWIALAEMAEQPQDAERYYAEALRDLDRAMGLALQSSEPTPTPIPIRPTTPTFYSTNIPTVTPTVISTIDIINTVILTSTTTLTPTLAPILTVPMPTPTETPILPFTIQFGDLVQRRNAVLLLVYAHPLLAIQLMHSQESEYPNLRGSGLVLTPTLTATSIRTPTLTPTPRAGTLIIPTPTTIVMPTLKDTVSPVLPDVTPITQEIPSPTVTHTPTPLLTSTRLPATVILPSPTLTLIPDCQANREWNGIRCACPTGLIEAPGTDWCVEPWSPVSTPTKSPGL
ncbi:MAG: AAA-like domain-containing protein [Anaerolineae bacterium]|nr:AAA-like domain-containing protein [Anaerolineae bacterium]